MDDTAFSGGNLTVMNTAFIGDETTVADPEITGSNEDEDDTVQGTSGSPPMTAIYTMSPMKQEVTTPEGHRSPASSIYNVPSPFVRIERTPAPSETESETAAIRDIIIRDIGNLTQVKCYVKVT